MQNDEDMPAGSLPIEALRTVFAVVLDRETAARCVGDDPEQAISLWPSSLYELLARAATSSVGVWLRCAAEVEQSLGPAAERYDRFSPLAVAQAFVDCRDWLATRELAAMLWSILRRAQPSLDPMLELLAAELDVVSARRAAGVNDRIFGDTCLKRVTLDTWTETEPETDCRLDWFGSRSQRRGVRRRRRLVGIRR
jgi:hypothetical protein